MFVCNQGVRAGRYGLWQLVAHRHSINVVGSGSYSLWKESPMTDQLDIWVRAGTFDSALFWRAWVNEEQAFIAVSSAADVGPFLGAVQADSVSVAERF